MPPSAYIESRNGGYYVAGSRVPLDVVVNEFHQGRAPEAILDAYPSIGSLATVYGAITFILEHPSEIDGYLADRERAFEDVKRRYPMPPDLIERIELSASNAVGGNSRQSALEPPISGRRVPEC
jgi:uncharacterized protein (DUF433 family)